MRRRFSSGECPFSGPFASHGARSGAIRGVARVPLCGELSLPFRVVRISRLSGNSDTTACRTTAQVKLRRRGHPGSQCRNGRDAARNATRASLMERRPSFSALVTGLPAIWVEVFTSHLSGYLGRSPLFQGRSRFRGGCSCRVPLLSGLAGVLSSSLFITGALYIAIAVPISRC